MSIHNCPSCTCTEKAPKWPPGHTQAVRRRRQARLLDAAANHRKEWTDEEYRLLETNLSDQDVAKLTGRSYYAIRTKRYLRRKALRSVQDQGCT